MRASKPTPIATIFRGIAPPPTEPDAGLLRRFIDERDEPSFHGIIRRHGGLVLDVCRSVLGNDADADDAFQATFLTLARRARSVRNPAALASWLHGTAYRTSLKARVAASRRRKHEAIVITRTDAPTVDPSWAEVREAIHEEVNRLPDKVRGAIVLCYLMGRTQEDAGRALGLKKDGIKKRLERGRELLRQALMRRGLGPVAILATAVTPLLTAPTALAASTSELAIGFINGTIPAGTISASTLKLIEPGTHMLSATKLLVTTTLFAMFAIATIAITWNEPTATATAAPKLPPERKDQPVAGKTELDGVWKVVSVSYAGKDVPEKEYAGLKFTIQKGKLEIGDFPQPNEKTWDPDHLRKAAIRLKADAKPKEIDLTLDQAVAKNTTIPGIYQIYKGQLKIGVRMLKTANMPRPKGYSTVSETITTYTLELVPEADEAKK